MLVGDLGTEKSGSIRLKVHGYICICYLSPIRVEVKRNIIIKSTWFDSVKDIAFVKLLTINLIAYILFLAHLKN